LYGVREPERGGGVTQLELLPARNGKPYRPVLTATTNRKGVLEVDTVKGCAAGMANNPRGCYDDCYAAKTARVYGRDFSVSVSRRPVPGFLDRVLRALAGHTLTWYRIGVAGDPSLDWDNTVTVCELLRYTKKIPVVVTKHWLPASDDHLWRLAKVGAVFNTSVSGMDTDAQLDHRLAQLERVVGFRMVSVCRVVTCDFGSSAWARRCLERQRYLVSFPMVIDTPFRTTGRHPHVQNGDIVLTRRQDAVGGGSRMVSLWNKSIYLGQCTGCPDQCGADWGYANG
jgi:hypothetical protein